MRKKTSRREFIRGAGFATTGMMVAAHPLSGSGREPQAPTGAATSMGARFHQLLQRTDPFQCIAVYDGPSARLVEIAGFDSVFIGGTSTALENGLPDWGLTSISELLEFAARIAEDIDIPVLADADDGGGNPLTVYRATQAFERAGMGAVMFEDRIRAERIGQSADVISTGQMVDRIRAAVDARSEIAIVARSDALAADRPMEEALERGVAYAEAGADAFFFAGMPLADHPRAADVIGKPLMGQMRPNTTLSEAREARLTVALYPTMLQTIAQGAIHKALTELKTTGVMAGRGRSQPTAA